ncbi:hypothetical protein TNCV_1035771 [Trichonephila clavipes]|nr:hypothetical protein TNCV_1035771 [Trichonephila clavipes]
MAPWPRALVTPQLVDHKNPGQSMGVVLVLDQLQKSLSSAYSEISIKSEVSEAVTVATSPFSLQSSNQESPSLSMPLHFKAPKYISIWDGITLRCQAFIWSEFFCVGIAMVWPAVTIPRREIHVHYKQFSVFERSHLIRLKEAVWTNYKIARNRARCGD